MENLEKISTPEEEKPKIYKVDNVILGHSINSAGGVDVVEGTLYKFVENNEEAGVLAHSVGPHGESTGIFTNMEGTATQEVTNIVEAPDNADMSIPEEYEENSRAYDEAMKDLEERQNEE